MRMKQHSSNNQMPNNEQTKSTEEQLQNVLNFNLALKKDF